LNQLDRSVIVAMIAMRVVQMTVDKIIDMVAMRNWLVTATGAVNVPAVVPRADVARSAPVWIDCRNVQRMLFDSAVGIHVVQMAIVQVIDVVFMLDGRVSAIGAVLVIVVFMDVSHRIVP